MTYKNYFTTNQCRMTLRLPLLHATCPIIPKSSPNYSWHTTNESSLVFLLHNTGELSHLSLPHDT